MERKKIFLDIDVPLTFEDYVKELNLIYITLNINNTPFLMDKYNIYLELYNNYKLNNLKLTARFNKSLLGFKPIMNTKCVEFYIDRGYSEIEAYEILHNAQVTYSIENIQTRYSLTYDEALIKREEIIKSSTLKRMNTMKERYSKDELDEINYKKGASLRYEFYIDKINPNTNIIYTHDEIIKLLKIRQGLGSKTRVENNKNNPNYKIQYNTTVEYWLQFTSNLSEAYNLLIDRQSTFTLEKCIEKHGEENGTFIYNERQRKWIEKMENKTIEEKTNIALKKFRNNKHQFYSNESIKYFDIIIKILNDSNLDIIFLYKESELLLNELDKIYFYDFCIPDLNIIIEYNGSHVHPSPLLTEKQKDEWKHPYTKVDYNTVIEKEKLKEECAIKNGYKYYVIYDYEKYDKLNFIIEEIKNEFYKRRNVE